MTKARGTRREVPATPADDLALFRAEMRGVAPAPPTNRIEPWREKAAPIPAKRREDEQAVLEELARLTLDGDDVEFEDDGVFLRAGLPRDILRKLRRTHWVIQETLDLHGLSGDEAALATAQFLSECKRLGLRCVRIVHGKGLRSRGKEPVLKRRIRKLLTRRDEVLAFVEPRAVHGGGGAVVALLDA
ncbi:MAG: Smr/MutS family protein [Usitatibacter sp.]